MKRASSGAAALCFALLTLLCAVAPAVAQARNPFSVGISEGGGSATGITGWILAEQGGFEHQLSAAVRAAKADGSALWSLIGLSLAYGVFHAAGPGHGKAVLASYMVANERALRRGIVLSFLAALLQGLMAIALVGILAFGLHATAQRMKDAAAMVETLSFAGIACLGLWLSWRKGMAFVDLMRHAPSVPHLSFVDDRGGTSALSLPGYGTHTSFVAAPPSPARAGEGTALRAGGGVPGAGRPVAGSAAEGGAASSSLRDDDARACPGAPTPHAFLVPASPTSLRSEGDRTSFASDSPGKGERRVPPGPLQRASSSRFVCVDGDAVHAAGCAHCHAPDPARLGESTLSVRTATLTVFAAGSRPCSGAILVLVFAMTQGLFFSGVAAVLAMSLGVAVTTAALASVAVLAKGAARRLTRAGSRTGALVLSALELGAAVAVLLAGTALLIGYTAPGA